MSLFPHWRRLASTAALVTAAGLGGAAPTSALAQGHEPFKLEEIKCGEPSPPLTVSPVRTVKTQHVGISLNALQRHLDQCRDGDRCKAEAVELCGLAMVEGFGIDKRNNELTIWGTTSAYGRKPLHVDDLAVALNVTWDRYHRQEGNKIYVEEPGVTIDPPPDLMKRLMDVMRASRSNDPGEAAFRARAEAWRKVCTAPERARVLGMPERSHTGQMLLLADYELKSMANGTISIESAGVESRYGRRRQRAVEEICSGKQVGSPASMDRFWFHIGDRSASRTDSYVTLDVVEIKLSTEAQFLSSSGRTTGSGRPDPEAEEFARDFGTNLRALSGLKPSLESLEAIGRLFVLARAMRQNPDLADERQLQHFLSARTLMSDRDVEPTLPGVPTYRRLITRSRPNETAWNDIASCGGVGFGVDKVPTDQGNSVHRAAVTRAKDSIVKRPRDAICWRY